MPKRPVGHSGWVRAAPGHPAETQGPPTPWRVGDQPHGTGFAVVS